MVVWRTDEKEDNKTAAWGNDIDEDHSHTIFLDKMWADVAEDKAGKAKNGSKDAIEDAKRTAKRTLMVNDHIEDAKNNATNGSADSKEDKTATSNKTKWYAEEYEDNKTNIWATKYLLDTAEDAGKNVNASRLNSVHATAENNFSTNVHHSLRSAHQAAHHINSSASNTEDKKNVLYWRKIKADSKEDRNTSRKGAAIMADFKEDWNGTSKEDNATRKWAQDAMEDWRNNATNGSNDSIEDTAANKKHAAWWKEFKEDNNATKRWNKTIIDWTEDSNRQKAKAAHWKDLGEDQNTTAKNGSKDYIEDTTSFAKSAAHRKDVAEDLLGKAKNGSNDSIEDLGAKARHTAWEVDLKEDNKTHQWLRTAYADWKEDKAQITPNTTTHKVVHAGAARRIANKKRAAWWKDFKEDNNGSTSHVNKTIADWKEDANRQKAKAAHWKDLGEDQNTTAKNGSKDYIEDNTTFAKSAAHRKDVAEDLLGKVKNGSNDSIEDLGAKARHTAWAIDLKEDNKTHQ